MKLAEYLKKHNLTHEEFAEKIQVSRPLVTRLLNKTRNPSAHLMKLIEDVSDGEVTMQDLFNPDSPSRLKSKQKKKTEKP